MRAIVYDTYGPPEVLRLADLPQPTPAPDEICVRVRATTVNRTDCGFRSAEYFVTRLFSGLFRPKRPILGSEIAGEVSSIGRDVTTFAVGDRVFGLSPDRFGAHADYVCVPQTGAIATIPEGISFEEAAAVLDGLMLGNNMIRQVSFDTPKDLLVIGASGSIGSAVLQLAKIRGARVTAVGNPGSVELLRSLGADVVLDYTKDDFVQRGGTYDAIIDSVGKSSFSACRHLLTPRGLYVSSELGPYWENPFLALAAPLMPGRKVGFPIPSITQAEVLAYRALLAAGRYRAVIDRTYPLEDFLEATRYVETGQKTGNVVLTLSEASLWGARGELLQRASSAPCYLRALSSDPRSLAGLSLLVTDDHADSADLLDCVLTARGATVRTSYSPRDTLALLGTFKPDALLLDISMPEMDGYTLLTRIRGLPGLADVPAIAVTGHASERDRDKATAAGFSVHTAKPVDAEAIVFLLADLLSAKSEAQSEPPAVAALEELLARGSLIEVLRALNARTSYRFTALYRYDGPVLRSVALVDRLDASAVRGADAPLETTFCGIVGRDRAGFATSEGRADPRVAGLPLREDVRSYCGALVRYPDGTPFGSLCHFDLERRDVQSVDLALLEAFAPSLARIVAVDVF